MLIERPIMSIFMFGKKSVECDRLGLLPPFPVLTWFVVGSVHAVQASVWWSKALKHKKSYCQDFLSRPCNVIIASHKELNRLPTLLMWNAFYEQKVTKFKQFAPKSLVIFKRVRIVKLCPKYTKWVSKMYFRSVQFW